MFLAVNFRHAGQIMPVTLTPTAAATWILAFLCGSIGVGSGKGIAYGIADVAVAPLAVWSIISVKLASLAVDEAWCWP